MCIYFKVCHISSVIFILGRNQVLLKSSSEAAFFTWEDKCRSWLSNARHLAVLGLMFPRHSPVHLCSHCDFSHSWACMRPDALTSAL